MPKPYVEKMAKKKKISIDAAENMWNKAKGYAEKQGYGDNYAYITGIFKNMLGERLSFKEFSYILELNEPVNSVSNGGTNHHDVTDGLGRKQTIVKRKKMKKKKPDEEK